MQHAAAVGAAVPQQLRTQRTGRPSRCSAGRSAARRQQAATAASGGSVIRELQSSIATGKRTAVDVVKEHLDRAEASQATLHSFITLNRDAALRAAADVDAARAAGKPLGPLAGVPIAVKDNICTRGIQTTAGSRILEGFCPPYDATVTAKLLAAGAIIIGKTNMDEFGMGSSTENSAYAKTANPRDNARVPGGSSGGSAAAVAADLCAAALGTDTGGSIRQPASFCGCVGLKPTYGRVSRYGLIAYASSLDVIGPMTRTVEDAALLMSAIAGRDARDATTSDAAVEDYAAGLPALASLASKPLAGMKLGVVRETAGEGVSKGVQEVMSAAVKRLGELGAEVVEVSLPSFALGLPAYYVIAPSEASSNLSRYDGLRYGPQVAAGSALDQFKATRGQRFGPEVKRRILMGTYALSAGYYDAYYKRAQQVRTVIRQEMTAALMGVDALITPAAPTVAYKLGEKTSDPLAMYVGDLMTVNVNLAGLPALVVPAGEATPEDGGSVKMPVGIQLIGRDFGEAALLKLGHVFECTRP